MTTRRILTPEEQTAREQQIELLKTLAAQRGTFESIANPLLARRFEVLPVIFKTPALRNYQKMPLATRIRLAHPWHNVAVWSQRGVGNLMFVDIDDPTIVRNRIEAETEQLFPRTYTVMTRPFSEHVHYYFLQTKYSVKKFGTTMNIRDLDDLKTTLYDVKGVGGASYVVAAGSIRENGDRYEVEDGFPVQEIPTRLVDWIAADFKKFNASKAALKRKHAAEQLALEAKFTPEQRAEMRAKSIPEGFYIAEPDTRMYLAWRAGQLASFGFPRDFIQQALRRIVVEDCVNGVEYLRTHEKKIRETAYNPELNIGNPSWFYQRAERQSGLVMQEPEQSRHGAMVEIMESFPGSINSEEAWKFLREGVTDFEQLRGQKQMVAEAREEAGFESKPLGNHRWLWVRKESR